jgi:hypothetical protein
MSDAAKELKILISEDGAESTASKIDKVTSAQDKLAASAVKVTATAGGAAKATGSLGDEIGKLGARQNAAKDVIEGVASAAKGSEGALFGAAKAASNLWAILTNSTPIGRMVQLFALAVSATIAFAASLRGASNDAETLARKEEEAAKAAKKMADEAKAINDLQVASAVGKIKEIQKAFDDATASARALRAAQDAVDNAEMGLALEQTQAETAKRLDGVTDPEVRKQIEMEGKAAELEVRAKFGLKGAAGKLSAADQEMRFGRGEVDAAKQQLNEADAPVRAVRADIRRAREAIPFLSDQEVMVRDFEALQAKGLDRTPEEEARFTQLLDQVPGAQAALAAGDETFQRGKMQAKGTPFEGVFGAYEEAKAREPLAETASAGLRAAAQQRLKAAEGKLPVLALNQKAAALGVQTSGVSAASALRQSVVLRGQAGIMERDRNAAAAVPAVDTAPGATAVDPNAGYDITDRDVARRDFFDQALGASGGAGLKGRATEAAVSGGGFRGRNQAPLETADAMEMGRAAAAARKAGASKQQINDAKGMGADGIEILKEIAKNTRGGARAG